LRAEGFSCSLEVLYRGLGISKLKFLIKKIEIFFFSFRFFPIFGHQNPGSRTRSGTGSAIRKNSGSGSIFNQCGSALNQCGSATLEKMFESLPCTEVIHESHFSKEVKWPRDIRKYDEIKRTYVKN
jgi:hypothetical protein